MPCVATGSGVAEGAVDEATAELDAPVDEPTDDPAGVLVALAVGEVEGRAVALAGDEVASELALAVVPIPADAVPET